MTDYYSYNELDILNELLLERQKDKICKQVEIIKRFIHSLWNWITIQYDKKVIKDDVKESTRFRFVDNLDDEIIEENEIKVYTLNDVDNYLILDSSMLIYNIYPQIINKASQINVIFSKKIDNNTWKLIFKHDILVENINQWFTKLNNMMQENCLLSLVFGVKNKVQKNYFYNPNDILNTRDINISYDINNELLLNESSDIINKLRDNIIKVIYSDKITQLTTDQGKLGSNDSNQLGAYEVNKYLNNITNFYKINPSLIAGGGIGDRNTREFIPSAYPPQQPYSSYPPQQPYSSYPPQQQSYDGPEPFFNEIYGSYSVKLGNKIIPWIPNKPINVNTGKVYFVPLTGYVNESEHDTNIHFVYDNLLNE